MTIDVEGLRERIQHRRSIIAEMRAVPPGVVVGKQFSLEILDDLSTVLDAYDTMRIRLLGWDELADERDALQARLREAEVLMRLAITQLSSSPNTQRVLRSFLDAGYAVPDRPDEQRG